MNAISYKPHFQHMMQSALSQGKELFPKQHFESQTCLVTLFFHSPPLSCCIPSVNMRMMAQSWNIPVLSLINLSPANASWAPSPVTASICNLLLF